jgi:hypothetical protein
MFKRRFSNEMQGAVPRTDVFEQPRASNKKRLTVRTVFFIFGGGYERV